MKAYLYTKDGWSVAYKTFETALTRAAKDAGHDNWPEFEADLVANDIMYEVSESYTWIEDFAEIQPVEVIDE